MDEATLRALLEALVATPDMVEKNRKRWDDIYRQLFR